MSCFNPHTVVAAALLPLFLTLDVHAASGADPASATATATMQPYESVFKNYQATVDETTSPDKLWRSANDAVAAAGGHGGMPGMPMDGSITKGAPTPPAPMHHGMDMHEGHKGK
ncbi:MAG: hypothetical protein H7327_10340 [Herminiimonas sp.]|nr:hypothetical protein [Herminiimonas sp.]